MDNDKKTKLVDNRKTTLLKTPQEDKNTTRLIDKDKTKLVKKEIKEDATVLVEKESFKESNLIEDAFKGLKIKEYVTTSLLSDTGGEAYVFLCSKEGDSKKYVAKIYKKDVDFVSLNTEKMSSINSEYIMPIIDKGKIRGKYYEILPYYKNGTLLENIKSLSLDFIKEVVVKELNEGLKAIHEKGLVHNDIKPQNIFLTDDKKHIVIGDFGIVSDLNGRDYATKYVGGLTEVFSAPEAYMYSSLKCDYYSFGMTLYHLGFKGDPFADMSSDRVRGMIVNDTIVIDSSMDSELADLIYMLIRNSPKERIDYDGVNKWLNNNKIYSSYRKDRENLVAGDIEIVHEFNGITYNSMYKLTCAMNEEYDLGYKHYVNGFIQEDVDRSLNNQDLAIELKEIRKQFKDDLDLAYFLTLHKLNPKLDFVYKGINYGGFKEYLESLMNDYKQTQEFIDIAGLKYLLDGSDQKVIEIVDKIDNMKISSDLKRDMLLNYFCQDENIFYKGNKYRGLKEFSGVLFNDDLSVNELDIDKDCILEDFLVYKFGFNNDIYSYVDLFDKHCKISKLINGYVSLEYVSSLNIDNFKNTKEILDYLEKEIVEKKDIVENGDIVRFVKSGDFKTYYAYEENPNEDFKNLLEELKEIEDELVIAKLYWSTSENKKFFIDKKEFVDIKGLIKYLSSVSDLDDISTRILENKYFYIWLEAKGYKVSGGSICQD